MNKYFFNLLLSFILLVCNGATWSAQVVTYYHTDNVGSPIAASDNSGAVIWREEYRPFGTRTRNESASSDSETWYAGKRHDEYVNLTYSQARWYDPEVGRFMGVDPVKFKRSNILSFNKYIYGINNPYKYTDPDGSNVQLSII